MNQELIAKFQNVRRVATPIVVVRTSDANTVAESLAAAFPDDPVFQWDIARGFKPRGEKKNGANLGARAIELVCGVGTPEEQKPESITNPAEAMSLLQRAPAQSIVLVFNTHALWHELPTSQAIWNLRDLFKSNKRTLILLTTPEARVVRELESDTIVIDDPLPDEAELARIIVQQCQATKPQPLPIPPGYTPASDGQPAVVTGQMLKFVDAIKGLSAFVAEQVVALALRKVSEANPHGISMSELWERKRQAVEMTPGASVYRGSERFSDIGGHDGLKRNLMRVINSKRPVKLVVIWDEFEKMSAGASGDNTGVSQYQEQQILTFMQDRRVRGVMLMGHPGAGKTIVAKAMANEAGCLCITADMGAMKTSHLGESEAMTRAFFALILAIAGEGGAFFVATCNSTGSLKTEVRRRFKTGFYFVDLPTEEEKDQLWALKRKQYGIDPKMKKPNDTNWTGAEIENCCEKADEYGITLVEAATEIVPVAQAQPKLIVERRNEAHGTMLSAATGVTYQQPGKQAVKVPTDAWIASAGVRSVGDLPES